MLMLDLEFVLLGVLAGLQAWTGLNRGIFSKKPRCRGKPFSKNRSKTVAFFSKTAAKPRHFLKSVSRDLNAAL